MTDKCQACGQALPSQIARGSINVDAFRDLCRNLLRSPNCTDPKFRSALEDFPAKLERYGSFTEPQRKFFTAIHKTVFGTWPPDLTKLDRASVDPLPLPTDDSDIPF